MTPQRFSPRNNLTNLGTPRMATRPPSTFGKQSTLNAPFSSKTTTISYQKNQKPSKVMPTKPKVQEDLGLTLDSCIPEEPLVKTDTISSI